jgi:predicted transglutaminase-like cysteine proteinase
MPCDSHATLALVLVALHAPGCAHVGLAPPSPTPVAFFAMPAPDDPWSAKIAGWQQRERAGLADLTTAPASVSGAGDATSTAAEPSLREKFASFRREQQRRQARDVAAWVQENARGHYRPDGGFDHWATLEETLAAGGDDCDGLELLAFNLLRELGFSEDEVFRAIVYRAADGQHHMVTLWFEDARDPWVIDPTGAMTRGMPRLSQVAGWEALKVFDGEREFTPHAVAAKELAGK